MKVSELKQLIHEEVQNMMGTPRKSDKQTYQDLLKIAKGASWWTKGEQEKAIKWLETQMQRIDDMSESTKD